MSPSTHPRRILVLEDELLYLELIIASCQKIGYEVISARTVDEALALMQEMRTVDLTPMVVDAIWLDHFLPEKNGPDFMKVIRETKDWAEIPVFLVTNAVETEITNWYVKAGVKQVYTKINNVPSKIMADIDLYLQRAGQAGQVTTT